MATFNKFDEFVLDLAHKIHDLETDQITQALTAAANAPVAANDVLADLTEISYTNLSSRDVTTASSTQSSGTYSLVLTDHVLTASGTVATFRYVVHYNNTASNDELINWYDYGGNVSLGTGETFTTDYGASFFTLT